MYYRGRDMALCHRGMRISESAWNVFLGHAAATLAKFQVPEAEQRDVVAFVQGLKRTSSNSRSRSPGSRPGARYGTQLGFYARAAARVPQL